MRRCLCGQPSCCMLSLARRLPYSPTRTQGIAPNCNKCTDGMFINVMMGSLQKVRLATVG